MSEQATEPEAIVLPHDGDAAFSALMDALAPEEAGTGAGAPASEGGAEAPAASGAAGAAAPAAGQPEQGGAPAAGGGAADAGGADASADAGAGAGGDAGAAAAKPDAADTGKPAAAEAEGAAPAGDLPAGWTADADALAPQFGELSTKLEERTAQGYQAVALEEVQKEHGAYFEALEQHPRLLVGKQVPNMSGEGSETLANEADAKSWQEAVKHVLASEVRGRATKAMNENAQGLATVHSSIELFQSNKDLIPGTKQFDVELAKRFVGLVTPYELRVDGKLHGYTIPTQPIIDQLRTDLSAERAAKASAAAAAPTATSPAVGATSPPAATAKTPAEPPQAGIQSKAGTEGEGAEDFSTLFGTIGLPNLRI